MARQGAHRRGLRRVAGRHRGRLRRALKLLLDTRAALWWLAGDPRFGTTAAGHLENAMHRVLLSAAVVWEVAIKRSLGMEAPDDFADLLLGAGASPLPIGLEHASLAGDLPWHHRDPFDRVLVAQAITEGAVLVSDDQELARYGVPLVW